jgi:hypothetical protein
MVLFGNDGMVDDEEGIAMKRPGVSVGEGLTINLLDYQNGQTVMIATEEVPAGDHSGGSHFRLTRDAPEGDFSTFRADAALSLGLTA